MAGRRKFLSVVLALGLGACGHTGDDAPRGWGEHRDEAERVSNGPTFAQYFRRFDADKDGKLSREELDKVLHAQFDTFDANRDRHLDQTETRAANATLLTDYWDSPVLDWDGDGFVSFDEFASQWQNVFATADANHDNVLDADELAAAMNHSGRPRPPDGRRGQGGEGGSGNNSGRRRPGG
jgi:Ca2+-binding EF-hand superfamily protein